LLTAEKEDPIKIHKQGTSLYDTGKYKDASEKFLQSSELYEKKSNFFDASNMMYKAGECSFMLKDYDTAIERFNKSAEIAFSKGFDRFGVSALEYIVDSYKALKKEKSREFLKVQKKIKEVKEKLASQMF
jgi:tetratricopeptide (TPR) repeat protein